jgi:phosphoribosyl 1,2-cyclic phosphate phosphodiesterase
MTKHPKLKVTVLGSGTSTGVPVIGCDCAVCKSTEPKNNRTRASVLITTAAGQNIVIDTGPDFRAQMLRAQVRDLEAVFYTHLHSDHCAGLDDLRAFFFKSQKPMPCYLAPRFFEEIKSRFHYVFQETGYEGTKPQLKLRAIAEGDLITVAGLECESFSAPHGNMATTVYRINNFAYATDFKSLPKEVIRRWRGKIKVMVASGIHFRTHPSHSVVPETVALFEELGVERGIITHLSHEVDYATDRSKLPPAVSLAYDGMIIDVN